MRVLLVHNFYSSKQPSGENQVLEAEHQLLESNGHEVIVYSRHSDELLSQGVLGKVKGACATPWNPWSSSSLVRELKRFNPEVVHVHNTFPLISPSIFSAIGDSAARVLTLHNYRLLCPAAIPMRQGIVCTDCIDKGSVMPSLMYGCYRNSRVATLPLAANVALHRFLGTWRHQVDAFIALTNFQRLLMADGGLPIEKIYVKPNFYPGLPDVVHWGERGSYVVFAGRLSAEKGVRTLIRAWQNWGIEAPELRLVGDGDLRRELETMAQGLPVRFLGQLSAKETQEQIARASLQILPSEWFEGFPMVVREAFAFGTPAAVSNLGPLPSIVQNGVNGLVFDAGNSAALLETVKCAWNNKGLLEELGTGARMEFLTKYNERTNYDTLMNVYEAARKSKQ